MKDIMKEKLSQIIYFAKTKRNFIVTGFVVILFACMSFSVSYGYFSDENTSSILDGKVYNFEEKNKTLKFYIETGYQTGVYVLSSNMPSDGYTFNSSKSTYDCTNAVNVSTCNAVINTILPSTLNYFLIEGITGSLYFDAKEDTQENADIIINLYKKPNSSGCGSQCYYKKTSYTMHELATQGYYYASSSCTNGATISKIDVDAGIIEVDASSKTVCSINFDYGNFAGTILENNSVITTSTTLENDEVATSYEGLLKIEDDFGDSYIFRGGQPNNYVKLYDKYWRILRINGNGTVRLVYWGSSTSRTAYGTMPYNPSIIKGKGDYLGSLIQQNSIILYGSGNLTTDSVFCNDKQEYSNSDRTNSITSDDTTTTIYYGSLNPWYPSDIKSLACSRVEDTYTTGQMYQLSSLDALVTTKNNSVGNYDLSSSYGLITASEYLLAGGGYTEENPNTKFYLYNIGWTMSPSMYSSSTTRVYYVTSALFAQSTSTSQAYHPVISLKGDTKVTGSGTATDPYVPVES